MAENLTYIATREQGRGKVLIFAHNAHLQRGKAVRPWYEFWPVGSQLDDIFGPRYAVIGSALGTSDANGIGRPEAGTLEARFMSMPGAGHFILTHKGHGLPAAEIAALPTRSGSARKPGYSPLSTRSLTDFDCLAVLQSATYTRGAPPLPASNAAPEQT
jgi:erythromycin esterase